MSEGNETKDGKSREIPKGEQKKTFDAWDAIEDLKLDLVFHGVEKVQKSLQKASQDEKKEIARLLKEDLETDESRGYDHMAEEGRILEMLDAQGYAAVKEKIFKKGTEFLQHEEEAFKKSTSFAQIDKRLESLYVFITSTPFAEQKKEAINTYTRWQNEFMKTNSKKATSEFLQRVIRKDEDEEKSCEKLYRDFFKTTLLSKRRDQGAEALESKIKETNEGYIYEYSDTKNAITFEISRFGSLVYFRGKKRPDVLFSVDTMELWSKFETDPTMIDRMAQEAIRVADEEKTQEYIRAMDGYDLPKNKKIVHISLFDEKKEKMVIAGNTLFTEMLLSDTIRKRYDADIVPVTFTGDPKQALREIVQVKLEENKGKEIHVCVDIFTHGAKDAFEFTKKLSADDILQITKEFPQVTFTYNTIACYGGGAVPGIMKSQEYQKNKDIQKRLAFFLQTKSTVVNQAARGNTLIETVYLIHFIKALNEGKSYGAAAREADIKAKKMTPMDAEAIINGTKYSMGNQREEESQSA
jgi:hypothetical protein